MNRKKYNNDREIQYTKGKAFEILDSKLDLLDDIRHRVTKSVVLQNADL